MRSNFSFDSLSSLIVLRFVTPTASNYQHRRLDSDSWMLHSFVATGNVMWWVMRWDEMRWWSRIPELSGAMSRSEAEAVLRFLRLKEHSFSPWGAATCEWTSLPFLKDRSVQVGCVVVRGAGGGQLISNAIRNFVANTHFTSLHSSLHFI